jgi:hypothetical protein
MEITHGQGYRTFTPTRVPHQSPLHASERGCCG